LQVSFEIPAREIARFEAAIKEYYQRTGKDAAYVVNRQALNVAIKTAQNTPVADASAIRRIVQKPWWPKFVAKRIMGKGIRLTGKKPKRYGGRSQVRGSYTVEEARQASKQIVKNRLKKKGWVRSGWSVAIARLAALKLAMKGRVSGTPSFTRDGTKAPGDVVIATPGISPRAEIINRAAAAVPVASNALRHGLALAAADMREYVREKYGETAKEFSAK